MKLKPKKPFSVLSNLYHRPPPVSVDLWRDVERNFAEGGIVAVDAALLGQPYVFRPVDLQEIGEPIDDVVLLDIGRWRW